MKNIILSVCLLLIASCTKYDSKYNKGTYGSSKAPSTYVVKRGDSLFAIAWKYGIDAKYVQRLNGISNPNRINVGQRLRLKGSSPKRIATTKQPYKVTKKPPTKSSYGTGKKWVWPINGVVVRNFNAGGIGTNGLRISGKQSQVVNATESGVVAYQGDGLNGYGNVVIIKHKSGLLSAYGFLDDTYVKEGQKIKRKQKIGTVGYANNKKRILHFEIRKNGKPVNPKSYIGDKYYF